MGYYANEAFFKLLKKLYRKIFSKKSPQNKK